MCFVARLANYLLFKGAPHAVLGAYILPKMMMQEAIELSKTTMKGEKVMKTKVAVIAVLLSVVVAGTASARGGWGYGQGYYSQSPGYAYQQLDTETQAKWNAFYNETQYLRKQIMVKQAERQALIQNTNVDPAAVSKVSGELFDLMTTMHDKAAAAGFGSYMGPGSGRGWMKGGRGMGYGCRMM